MVALPEGETILDLVLTLATDIEETTEEMRDAIPDLLPQEAAEIEITEREGLTAALPAIPNDENTLVKRYVFC